MFSDREEVCEASGEATPPEELYPVEVPYFERTYRFNKRSADDFRRGGLRAGPPPPPPPALLPALWPIPGARDARELARWAARELLDDARIPAPLPLPESREDAAAILASPLNLSDEAALITALIAGLLADREIAPLSEVEAAVERHEECTATWPLFALYALARAELDDLAIPEIEPYRQRALDAAVKAMARVFKPPPRQRAAVIVVLIEAAAALLTGQTAEAKRSLTACIDFLDRRREPGLADPRLFLYLAKIYRDEGNLGGADKSFEKALRAAQDRPQLAALAHAGLARRAADSEDWSRALEHLRAYVRACPEDRRGRIDLACAYLKRLRSDVAREILEPTFAAETRAHLSDLAGRDGQREGEEGRLLLAQCLIELGETDRARQILAPIDDQDPAPPRGLHLLALCIRERPEALDLLRRARASEAGDVIDGNYLAILAEHAEDWIDAIASPEDLQAFAARLNEHAELLRASWTPLARQALVAFIAHEAQSRFEPGSAFAPDWIDKARSHHGFVNIYQVLTNLNRRRLGEAIQAEWRARAQAGAPLPLRLILKLLERLKQLPENDLGLENRWDLE